MVLILMIKHINHHIIICLTGDGGYDCAISHLKVSQILQHKVSGKINSFCGVQVMGGEIEAKEEEAKSGERGVKM